MTQVVDFRGVLRALTRRRLVLLVALWAGLIGAGLFVVVSPTRYVAKARVVLPPSGTDAQGHDTRDINTEIQIVRGAAVLGATTKAIQPAIDLLTLQRAISVRTVSPQIIEISAQSGSAARAAQLANAVASSYVGFADDSATSLANATAAAYAQEVSQLNQQVQGLDQQIASNTAALSGLAPAEVQRREAVIDTLRSEQASLSQALNLDQTRIADAQLQAQLSRQGTQVLQPALVPSHPASPKPLLDTGLGAVGGLLIGGILALAIENGDHRLRTRDSINQATGAPVLASLAAPAVERPDRCRTWLQKWEPSVVESYALRQAFARLGTGASGGRENLVLVGVAGDTAAPALAVEVAIFSALGGTETALVFASHDRANASLRQACRVVAPTGLSLRPGLAVHGATGSVEASQLTAADLIITVLMADAGPIAVPTWDRPTKVALVVSAGRASADRLEEVAAACLDAGTPLVGAFVANPDSADRSSGQAEGLLPVVGTAWASPGGHGNTPDAGNGRTSETANGAATANGSATAKANGGATPKATANGSATPKANGGATAKANRSTDTANGSTDPADASAPANVSTSPGADVDESSETGRGA